MHAGGQSDVILGYRSGLEGGLVVSPRLWFETVGNLGPMEVGV